MFWHSTALQTDFAHRDRGLDITCSSFQRGAGALAMTKGPYFWCVLLPGRHTELFTKQT